MMSAYVVGMAGGSGALYALRLVQFMLDTGLQVKVVVSPAAEKILNVENDIRLGGTLADKQDQLVRALGLAKPEVGLELYDHKDLAAPISSGSFPCAGMIVVPCSMGTMGRIAHGISSDLISRAADVSLKERRKLILVPRETPLSEIHLRNMLDVTRAGAVVMPAMPGFYHRPKRISDLVDMIVSRILDHLGIENAIFERWRGDGVASFLTFDE